MTEIQYSLSFIHIYKGLGPNLQEEVKNAISLFANPKNHSKLKVHKLNGRLKGRFSFYVNYKIRIIFRYENKQTVSLLHVGSHDEVY